MKIWIIKKEGIFFTINERLKRYKNIKWLIIIYYIIIIIRLIINKYI